MNIYKYRAKKGPQEIIEGSVEAHSEKEAIEKVSAMGYLPLRLEKESGAQKQPVLAANKKLKVRSSEITHFCRQIAILLKSGVPILKALSIIAEQSESQNLKKLLFGIYSAIKEGSTLSAALAVYSQVFSNLFIAMVRSGEDSGALPEVLLKIADYRAKQEEMLSRFRMAMAYPALMACVGSATVIFMLVFVMPRLIKIYGSMGQKLPLPTRILIYTSDSLRHGWFWVALIVIAVILILRRQFKTNLGKAALSKFLLGLPVLGKFVLRTELARFLRTLELLIRNGVPILKSIGIAIPVLENEIIKSVLKQSSKDLEQGGSFGKSLKKSKAIPLFMSNLIMVGEESGRLDDALSEAANTYEQETEESVKVMSSLLEPLMILAMGLIVGFIVISMLLPIFEINVMAS